MHLEANLQEDLLLLEQLLVGTISDRKCLLLQLRFKLQKPKHLKLLVLENGYVFSVISIMMEQINNATYAKLKKVLQLQLPQIKISYLQVLVNLDKIQPNLLPLV